MARFKKGESGNPQGRPKTFREYVRKLVGEHGEKAWDIIWEIARGERKTETWFATKDGPQSVMAKPTHKDQLAAAFGIVEHLVGRPAQSLELNGKDGGRVSFGLVIESEK